VKDIPKVAHFYQRHFGLKPLPSQSQGWMELTGHAGGCNIALHQASSAQKRGAEIKIVFGVADVRKFKREFANAKDPAGNSVQISSRGLK